MSANEAVGKAGGDGDVETEPIAPAGVGLGENVRL